MSLASLRCSLYHFHVKSKNSSGTLSVSGDFTFTTTAAPASGGGSAYTLTPSSTSVAAGASFSVSWTAPSTASLNDWISLFQAGAPGTAYGWFQFTQGATSGTFNLTAPAKPGQYEFRYMLQNTYSDVVRSTVVTVQ